MAGATHARLKKLEAELAAAKRDAAYHFEVVMGQARLLADAGDIFEELGLRNMWMDHLNRVTGGPTYTIGTVEVWEDVRSTHGDKADAVQAAKQEALRVTAQQHMEPDDDDPITAQSGLPVYDHADHEITMSGGNAGAAERT